MIPPLFSCLSSLGYDSPFSYEQSMGALICYESVQMQVKLRPLGWTPMSPVEFRRTRLNFRLRALERETHFYPGLAVEPVSHRRKDRNSSDLSFRFH
jgi:hypothetical protein